MEWRNLSDNIVSTLTDGDEQNLGVASRSTLTNVCEDNEGWVYPFPPESGIITLPPVYSQADVMPLVIGQQYVDVVFGSVQVDNTWVLVACAVYNNTDLTPLNIWPGIITNRTVAGFRVWFNGLPDSGNYYLSWAVSGVNITPVPATSYQFTGPSSGAFAVASTFTVRLPPSTTLEAPITVTPSDGGMSGTFVPSSVVLSSGSASATFAYFPTHYGAITLSVTNSGTLSDPANISFTCVAGFYDLTGPSSGAPGVPSTNFTVALPGGGAVLGTVTVTPHDGGSGGTFTPTTVGLTTGAPSATFTYTPVGGGSVATISTTNNGGLTDPGSLSYDSFFDPTTIAGCKLWLKADSLALADGTAISTWSDSSGNAHDALGTTTTRPIFKTNILNGKPVVRFDGVDDILSLTTEISIALGADFTAFVVYKSTGDNCLIGANSINNQIMRVGSTGLNALSVWDQLTTFTSTTLSVARTSWNIGISFRTATFVGFLDASGFLNNAGPGNTTLKLGTVGALGTPLALFTNGDIAEVIFYDNWIGGTPVSTVTNYLKGKYGIP